jgi:hypothetical protein
MAATVDNAVAALQRANAELDRQLDERTRQLDERAAERDEVPGQKDARGGFPSVSIPAARGGNAPGSSAPKFDRMAQADPESRRA